MSREFCHRRGVFDFSDGPIVVGIVNVTPDSFSDGGRYLEPIAAVSHARRLVDAGAAIVDVGGESTRPGAADVAADEQIARVVPVIRAIHAELDCAISVDTTSAAVAEAALEAGADIVNDISGLTFEPAIAELVARHGAGLVLMHTPGRPGVMQSLAVYDDVVTAVRDSLLASIERAVAMGVRPTHVAVDPGFGFGKSAEHNTALLERLDTFADLGCPLFVGVSRKRMLREVVGADPLDLDVATAVVGVFAAQRGAAMLRVHNVGAQIAALRAWSAWAR